MIRSIRWRVAIGTTTGVLLLATLASGAWYSLAADILRSDLDLKIDTQVRTLATLTRWNDGIELEFSDELMPEYLPGPDPCYFQVWRLNGSIVERSRSLGEVRFPFPARATPEGARWDLELPDGRAGRASALVFAVTEGHALAREHRVGAAVDDPAFPYAAIMVARSRVDLDRTLGALALSVFLVGIGLALCASLVVITLVHSGLRPLRRLSGKIAALDPRALPDSLHERALPTELEPIRARLDELLHRVREALERERRVAANLAHELRTPVSELQSVTEVALRWPEGEGHRTEALATAHTIAKRMAALTEAILALARPSSAEFRIERELLCLTDLARDVWTQVMAPNSAAAALDLAPNVHVMSDRAGLRIVLTNLFENALAHGSGDPVHCGLVSDGGMAELRVANRAHGVKPEDLARFGERFWRGDKIRTPGDRSHFGVGLAIATELCDRLDIEMSHRLENDMVVASLRIPTA